MTGDPAGRRTCSDNRRRSPKRERPASDLPLNPSRTFPKDAPVWGSEDMAKRSFLWFGMVAAMLLLLVPLTASAQFRMGRGWGGRGWDGGGMYYGRGYAGWYDGGYYGRGWGYSPGYGSY